MAHYINVEKLSAQIEKLFPDSSDERIVEGFEYALYKVKAIIASLQQEQPELTQVPCIEQELQKKGWMDYGLLISEIGLHRSNAIDRIKKTKERATEIKRNIAPHELAILGEYLESVGAEIVLCCLQQYCMDSMFTQDEVKEILQQEQPDFPTTDEQIKEFLATHPKIKVPEKYKNPDWLLKKQEQPEVDLEKAAQYVYESWMGGTMDDVRRDMVTLGIVLNARKEESK